jgi:hypothetical protein
VLPRTNELGFDLKMLATAFTLVAITSLLFGVLPALHLSRTSHLHAWDPGRSALVRENRGFVRRWSDKL